MGCVSWPKSGPQTATDARPVQASTAAAAATAGLSQLWASQPSSPLSHDNPHRGVGPHCGASCAGARAQTAGGDQRVTDAAAVRPASGGSEHMRTPHRRVEASDSSPVSLTVPPTKGNQLPSVRPQGWGAQNMTQIAHSPARISSSECPPRGTSSP